jgi:hypothetical protein
MGEVCRKAGIGEATSKLVADLRLDKAMLRDGL